MVGPLSLERFEHKVELIPLTLAHYESLVAMQKLCFPGMEPWTHDQLQSQLQIFSEGQLGIEVDGFLAASCSTLIVASLDYEEWHNWNKLSDNGYIRNHDPEGDVLYGIELMVHPDYRGMRLARRLYNTRKELASRYNLRSIIIGGRIPGYSAHSDRLSARAYVEEVCAKRLYDPVLTTQLANGFVLKRLIPRYLPDDTASEGYATFLEWTNLDYVPEAEPRRRRIARVIEPIRLGIVQYELRPISGFDEFARQSEFFVDAAADKGSDFLLFPELFTTQLLSISDGAKSVRDLCKYTEQYLELFNRLAVKYDINIIGGSQFTEESGRLYNVAYLFRRDGTLEKQYKIHITAEERRWWGLEGGKEVHVFETNCGRISILIGYDIEFPEIVRIAVNKGAQLLFVPFNASDRGEYLATKYCSQARCIENHVYVAISGVVGNLPFVDNADVHYGVSGIYTPCDISFSRDGIAAECTPNVETVLIQDLDLELLRRHRQTGTRTGWLDRRSDVYQVSYNSDKGEIKI